MVPPNAKGVWLVQPGAGRVGRLAGTRPAFWLDRLGLRLDDRGALDLLGLACVLRGCGLGAGTSTPPRQSGGAHMAC